MMVAVELANVVNKQCYIVRHIHVCIKSNLIETQKFKLIVGCNAVESIPSLAQYFWGGMNLGKRGVGQNYEILDVIST